MALSKTALLCGLATLTSSFAATGSKPFRGRWDLTIQTSKRTYGEWMEVVEKNGRMNVLIRPRGRDIDRATDVRLTDGWLMLTEDPGDRTHPMVTWELAPDGQALKGVLKLDGRDSGTITAVRAPLLHRKAPKKWSAPELLFNGKDLTGWQPLDQQPSKWTVTEGELRNGERDTNLRTTRTFDDFKLHVEFRCPQGCNSGVFLRGRYEVQIENEPPEKNGPTQLMGGIYRRIAPAKTLPRKPGEWQSFDITLVGRYVTVVEDGATIVDNAEIAGITGGAIDSHEGEPGPIYLQGDHTGGLAFRNITISVPQR